MLLNDISRCQGIATEPLCGGCDRRNWRPGVMHPVIPPEVLPPLTSDDAATCQNYIPDPEREG